MTPFPAALPTKLTQQLVGNRDRLPAKVFAQDETRLGLQPILRRRITACGVHPVATVWPRFDNFSLFGAVAPTTGDSFFLELPLLNSAMFQRWVDDFAQTFAASFNLLVLDKGAFQTVKALRWPPNVATVPFPPYSPELNPMERLWRIGSLNAMFTPPLPPLAAGPPVAPPARRRGLTQRLAARRGKAPPGQAAQDGLR